MPRLQNAEDIMTSYNENTIKITNQGECHLGAVIGTESFGEQFI